MFISIFLCVLYIIFFTRETHVKKFGFYFLVETQYFN